jgi:hypothetical protein
MDLKVFIEKIQKTYIALQPYGNKGKNNETLYKDLI